MVPGSTLMYGSSFTMLTLSPRDSRMAPREAAAMPLPSEETTPPVTQIKRVIVSTVAKKGGIRIGDAPGTSKWRERITGITTGAQCNSKRHRADRRRRIEIRYLSTDCPVAVDWMCGRCSQTMVARGLALACGEIRGDPQIADSDQLAVGVNQRQPVAPPRQDRGGLQQLFQLAVKRIARQVAPILAASTKAHGQCGGEFGRVQADPTVATSMRSCAQIRPAR